MNDFPSLGGPGPQPFPYPIPWPPRPFKLLSITSIEVTQAIQYNRAARHLTDPADRGPDNSVPLVQGKAAWVRVYVGSGFTWGTRLSGRLLVSRRLGWGGVYLPALTLAPRAPGVVTTEKDSYDTERSTLGTSLNFIIPADEMVGQLLLTAEIWYEGQSEANIADSETVNIFPDLVQTLAVRGVMIRYKGPNAVGTANLDLAAPTMANLMTTAAWSLTTMPVEAQGRFSSAGTIDWATPLTGVATKPGGCSQQWLDLNAAIAAARTADGNRTDVIYYGLLPNGVPIANVGGCATHGVTSGGNGDGVAMAHEIGHFCGLPHAPCGTPGDPSYPAYEPYDAAGMPNASLGEYGLDINNGTIRRPDSKDLMSYCVGDWFSLFNYQGLYNNSSLDPRPGSSARIRIPDLFDPFLWPWEYIPDPPADRWQTWRRQVSEPLVSVIAIVGPHDQVSVKSVMRLTTTSRLDGAMRSDRLVVQLLGREGEVLAEAAAQLLPSQGCGGGCGCGCDGKDADDGRNGPVVMQAFMPDVAPGSELRILARDDKTGEMREIWSRKAPDGRPKLGEFDVTIDGDTGYAKWSAEAASDVVLTFTIQVSKDKGRSWNAVAHGLAGRDAKFDAMPLPAGSLIFRLLAHDGFHSESIEAKPVKMAERPPIVAILHPQPGDRIAAGVPMRLWAAVDLRTGQRIDPAACQWMLDDTDVGNGTEVYVEAPKPGGHVCAIRVKTRAGTAEAKAEFMTFDDSDVPR
jgi:hypothetical protein